MTATETGPPTAAEPDLINSWWHGHPNLHVRAYTREHREDAPEIRDWKWTN
jgi:hypothetical protein